MCVNLSMLRRFIDACPHHFLARGCAQTFKHNTLETLYLVTSLFILLAGTRRWQYLEDSHYQQMNWCGIVFATGMTFQSGVAAVGGGAHLALTWLVALVLVSCISLFAGMLVLEVWRSVRFARTVAVAARKAAQATGPRRATRASVGFVVTNPLKAGPPLVHGVAVLERDGAALATIQDPPAAVAAVPSVVPSVSGVSTTSAIPSTRDAAMAVWRKFQPQGPRQSPPPPPPVVATAPPSRSSDSGARKPRPPPPPPREAGDVGALSASGTASPVRSDAGHRHVRISSMLQSGASSRDLGGSPGVASSMRQTEAASN